jgi:hypothetical protein
VDVEPAVNEERQPEDGAGEQQPHRDEQHQRGSGCAPAVGDRLERGQTRGGKKETEIEEQRCQQEERNGERLAAEVARRQSARDERGRDCSETRDCGLGEGEAGSLRNQTGAQQAGDTRLPVCSLQDGAAHQGLLGAARGAELM